MVPVRFWTIEVFLHPWFPEQCVSRGLDRVTKVVHDEVLPIHREKFAGCGVLRLYDGRAWQSFLEGDNR